VNNEFTLMAWK